MEKHRSGAVPAKTGARYLLLLALLVVASSCERGAKPAAAAKQPMVRATVITYRTIIEPGKKTTAHNLVVAGNVARSMDEADVWHLYDLGQNRVTTIDAIAGTHRTRTLEELSAERRRQRAESRVNARIARGSEAPVLLGIQTQQWVISAGNYQREIFIGKPGGVPPRLFGVMYATRLAESPATGVTPEIDAALLQLEGVPLADRATLPYGDATMSVDRSVLKIEQRDVPQAWFRVPDKSRDTTPAPAKK